MPERKVGTLTTLRPGKQPLGGTLKPHSDSFPSLTFCQKCFQLKDPMGKNGFRNLIGARFGYYGLDQNGLQKAWNLLMQSHWEKAFGEPGRSSTDTGHRKRFCYSQRTLSGMWRQRHSSFTLHLVSEQEVFSCTESAGLQELVSNGVWNASFCSLQP